MQIGFLEELHQLDCCGAHGPELRPELNRKSAAISQQIQSLSVQINERRREQINTNLELSIGIRNFRNDVSISNQFVLDEFYRVSGY